MGEKIKCSTLIKRFIKRLQLLNSRVAAIEGMGVKETVPGDVKEGHFAILAAAKNRADEKPARIVVKLCVLKHPAFLRLLEMAEEEYGFQQKGALAVPCRPDELHRILQDLEYAKATDLDTAC